MLLKEEKKYDHTSNQFLSYWDLLGHENLGYTEIRYIFNNGNGSYTDFVKTKADFAEKASKNWSAEGVNTFVSVNPRKTESGYSKDVSYLTNIVLDLDDLASDFTLPQSLVEFGYQVNSGRGVHIYIPVEPVQITDQNREEITQQLKQIKDFYKEMLKGFAKVDNVHDLARVMRCPGTINTKNNKLAELLINKPFKRIRFEDFISYIGTPLIVSIDKENVAIRLDETMNKIIANDKFKSVSEKVFVLVKYMIPLGYSRLQMLSIINSIKEKDKDYSQDIDRIISKTYDDVEVKPLNLYLDHYEEHIDKRELGFLTGIKFLDEKTGGLMRKELVVIGARPSVGKTTFCMNLILEFLEKDLKVLMYPTEMNFTSLIDKLVAIKCKIPLAKFRKNQVQKEELDKFEKAKKDISNFKFFVSEDASPELQNVEKTANDIKPDILVLDYVQRVNTRMPDKRSAELETYVRGLKNIAKRNNCCVIVASQLNRMGDEVQPDIKTLRDTDTLESEGDLVIMLGTENKLEQSRILNLYIQKNRYGELGYTPLNFDTVYGYIE